MKKENKSMYQIMQEVMIENQISEAKSFELVSEAKRRYNEQTTDVVTKYENEHEDKMNELDVLAKPIYEYLKKYYHPHAHVIIDSERALVVCDALSVPLK